MPHPLSQIPVVTLSGEETDLQSIEGKVALIVNTASKCGLTPQYEGLEARYQEYKDRGLIVLGFPCNQFARQEPGTAEEIGAFCQKNYGVSFPMYAKIDVNGPHTHPLFVALKRAAPGVLGSESIKWNFTKFLVARDGQTITRFASKTPPSELRAEIEKLLAAR